MAERVERCGATRSPNLERCVESKPEAHIGGHEKLFRRWRTAKGLKPSETD